jgi:hypothetical protein
MAEDDRCRARGGGVSVRGRRPGQTVIDIVPLTLPIANQHVQKWHRHHAPIPGGFAWYCVGAVTAGKIVGVAIAGRPTNRNNDDRQTVEVLRVATDGTPNACSALLGACARAAKAIGAARIITYTLSVETGSSLRGAGWTMEAQTGRSWWNKGHTRPRAIDRPHMVIPKHRWAKHFCEPIEYGLSLDQPNTRSVNDAQLTLAAATEEGS